MPNSLRNRVKKLCYQGVISEKDRERLIGGLDFAESVVRCKDCRFYDPYDITKAYDCERGLLGAMQDDFCSHGERAEVQPEIIRCKDCKWWGVSDYNNTLGIPICKRFSGVRDESDFCSRAERREDG